MVQRDSPGEETPAPLEPNMWSTVQAAITGGWGTTVRLTLILVIIIIAVTALGVGAATPLSAVLRFVQ